MLEGLGDYKAAKHDQLSFAKGERLRLIQRYNDVWWWSENKQGRCDAFPFYSPMRRIAFLVFV